VTPPAPRKQPNLATVTTINRDGSRFMPHPADVRGRFTRARRLVAGLLIAIYVLLPWLRVGSHPAVFLDVLNRRFHLFGWTLAVQDVWLLFFLVSGVAFSLFIVTAFLGRVWCGWACPQTVFLEHLFRRVERWIDGDAPARRLLDAAPWTPQKWARRIVKHALFGILAAAIAHVFLAYFISLPQLWQWMTQSPRAHWGAFLFVGAATAVLYGNFAWFREQLCIVICPYGRLQSALTDEHSLNVAYDARRGDPPGHAHDPQAGACIDCRRCVQVCPTGIDIRLGLQLECIACTACIDACDEIMDRVGRPRGLIRYASEEGLAGRRTRWLRPRTFLYLALLAGGLTAAALGLTQIEPVVASVTRMAGAPFFVGAEQIRNQYQLRLINKGTAPVRFSVAASGPAGVQLAVAGLDGGEPLAPLEERVVTLLLLTPRAGFTGNFRATLRLHGEPGDLRIERTVEFIGPDPRLL
jgi:cytochrome c oxidase accessory protein FixG